MKNSRTGIIIAVLIAVLVVGIGAFVCVNIIKKATTIETVDAKDETVVTTEEKSNVKTADKPETVDRDLVSLDRALIVSKDVRQYYNPDLVPSVPEYEVSPDFSELINEYDVSYLPDEAKNKLYKNKFVVMESNMDEFFSAYESNRYSQTPNFVTVDSLMHSYHLYFAYLLKTTERTKLVPKLQELSEIMYNESLNQYETLKGSEWENAAKRNVGFFAVALELLGEGANVPDYISDDVREELIKIDDASGISMSELFGIDEDYSQYKPRGYYAGDADLEKYFKTMMWYGRMSFVENNEDHNRSALLINVALDGDAFERWEEIYSVTSFFAGASDDNTPYEYKPVIESAYGEIKDIRDIIGDEAAFSEYEKLTSNMKAPEINSIPVDEKEENVIISYRFMGQRFSLDSAIFTQLIYRNVEEASDGSKRMLPTALDVPAALGSDKAYEIIKDMGMADYPNYDNKLDEVRQVISEKEDTDLWNASLYAGWLNTLRPIIEPKGKGYPVFMQNDEWTKKSIESFLGSYTELKHDTVLYSKQAMAEMGGGDVEELDDRGYVEPEPVVYSRFAVLAESTRDGLKSYGLLDKTQEETLDRLAEMAKMLVTISEKELVNQKLDNSEYDFIRDYGGDLEHIWYDVMKDESDDEYPREDEFPSSLVVDIATDPNGSVLECGTGGASVIYAIVPVDGTLRAARGSVYSFYEFEYPMSNRLTDGEWRLKIGVWLNDNYEYEKDDSIKKPEWTQSYRYNYEW